MKLVIDIDEVIYKYIKKFDEIPACGNIVYDACITGVHKGKLIPEEHGRFIDADKLEKEMIDSTPLPENVEQAINRLHKHSLNGVVAMDYVEIVLKDVFEG